MDERYVEVDPGLLQVHRKSKLGILCDLLGPADYILWNIDAIFCGLRINLATCLRHFHKHDIPEPLVFDAQLYPVCNTRGVQNWHSAFRDKILEALNFHQLFVQCNRTSCISDFWVSSVFDCSFDGTLATFNVRSRHRMSQKS